jgi:hypothetical protein
MSKRCPNGSRRNKKTGECEEHKNTVKNQSPEKPESPKKSTRCPKGTRKNKKTGKCEGPDAPEKAKSPEKAKEQDYIDFDNLEDKYYNTVYFPNVSEKKIKNETGLEEKFGGSKPFFIKHEAWPYKLPFIGQFKDRDNEKILYRIFSDFAEYDFKFWKELRRRLDVDGDVNSQSDFPYCFVIPIELNEENLKNQKIIECPLKQKNPAYEIINWEKSKELKPFYRILKGLKRQWDAQDVERKMHNDYKKSKYIIQNRVKIGGRCFEDAHMIKWPGDPGDMDSWNNTFLQLKKTKYLPIKSSYTFYITDNIEKTVRSEKDISNWNRDFDDDY